MIVSLAVLANGTILALFSNFTLVSFGHGSVFVPYPGTLKVLGDEAFLPYSGGLLVLSNKTYTLELPFYANVAFLLNGKLIACSYYCLIGKKRLNVWADDIAYDGSLYLASNVMIFKLSSDGKVLARGWTNAPVLQLGACERYVYALTFRGLYVFDKNLKLIKTVILGKCVKMAVSKDCFVAIVSQHKKVYLVKGTKLVKVLRAYPSAVAWRGNELLGAFGNNVRVLLPER